MAKVKDSYLDKHKLIFDSLLKVFRNSKFPCTLPELRVGLEKEVKFNLSTTIIEDTIIALNKAGYDIKKIRSREDTRYSLVRFGSFNQEDYYKILGKVETPIVFTSDQHMGSKGFSLMAWELLLEDCVKYNVKSLVCPGDLLQGLGVYRTEMRDVIEPDIDSQVDLGAKYFNMVPSDIKKHVVIGNHEEKIRGEYRVGFDPIKALSEKVANFNYYGSAAKLQLNKEFTILMVHGTGGPAYALSYPLQKVWDKLIELPTILAMGHFHQPLVIPMAPNKFIVECGSMQRENSYLLQKGITASVSWVVLKDIERTKADFIIRRPEVF